MGGKRQNGVALIMVLWLSMLMMTLMAGLLYAMRTENGMIDHARRTVQARAVADAAAHQAVLQLLLPVKERTLHTGGLPMTWEFEGSRAEIRAVGENGLIDINYASRALLAQVFKQAGAGQQDTGKWLDVLEDFRDVDDLRRLNGAEDADYERAGLPFGAKDAPFERIEELQQLLGMSQPLYDRLLQYLTVNSGMSGINPMLASRQLLLLLAEGDEAKVDAYLREREAALMQGQIVLPDFGTAFLDSTEQPAYRLQITVYGEESSSPPYVEERSIRLLPGENPPFMTHFRLLQKPQARFEG